MIDQQVEQELEYEIERYAYRVGRPALRCDENVFHKARDLMKRHEMSTRAAARAAINRALDTERKYTHQTGATRPRRERG